MSQVEDRKPPTHPPQASSRWWSLVVVGLAVLASLAVHGFFRVLTAAGAGIALLALARHRAPSRP